MSHYFAGGVPSSQVTTLLSFVFINLMELEIIVFVVSAPFPNHLPNGQIKKHTLLYLFISLIKVEHPLKTSNERTHM